MTMPSERRRALRWGRKTLEDIGNDPGAPTALKAEATASLLEYPDDQALVTCFLELTDERLARQLTAIAVVQGIFQRAAQCPDLGEQTRFAARATNRHFPQCWELSALAPREWVAFYLVRDMNAEEVKRAWPEIGLSTAVAGSALPRSNFV